MGGHFRDLHLWHRIREDLLRGPEKPSFYPGLETGADLPEEGVRFSRKSRDCVTKRRMQNWEGARGSEEMQDKTARSGPLSIQTDFLGPVFMNLTSVMRAGVSCATGNQDQGVCNWPFSSQGKKDQHLENVGSICESRVGLLEESTTRFKTRTDIKEKQCWDTWLPSAFPVTQSIHPGLRLCAEDGLLLPCKPGCATLVDLGRLLIAALPLLLPSRSNCTRSFAARVLGAHPAVLVQARLPVMPMGHFSVVEEYDFLYSRGTQGIWMEALPTSVPGLERKVSIGLLCF